MIKKKTTTIKEEKEHQGQYKKIKHIINELYRIKTINRTCDYTTIELKRLVIRDQHGRNVLKELKDRNITCKWLLKNHFLRVHKAFSTYLD